MKDTLDTIEYTYLGSDKVYIICKTHKRYTWKKEHVLKLTCDMCDYEKEKHEEKTI